MIRKGNNHVLLGLGVLAAVGLSACNIDVSLDGEEGSGVAETTSYTFDSFERVDISGPFEAEITVAPGPPTVEITVDDNLVDDLDVRVDDDELHIELESRSITFGVDPIVLISVPELTGLDLSGAAEASVATVDGERLSIDLSGASDASIQGTVDQLSLDVSGASDFRLDGSVKTLTLDVSGAGSADFTDAEIGTATADVSGGSQAEFDALDRLTGDLSGGATVEVGQDSDVSVETSGGATVERR